MQRPGKIRLTPREEQLLRLVSLGCSVKEVAAILDVAPATVDNHKARLMAKLGLAPHPPPGAPVTPLGQLSLQFDN